MNGSGKGGDGKDEGFAARREKARRLVNEIDAADGRDEPARAAFFDAVYERAQDDPAFVPWADLKPKDQLVEWLAAHPGNGRSAVDIACGLGDNAEALAAAGYATTAFDLSAKAIEWARRRFPDGGVDYCVADLLNPPKGWAGGFDLVHECYTLQAVAPSMLEAMTEAVARLVAPGGTLLVYTRIRADNEPADGPPWPLREFDAMRFAEFGFELVARTVFENRRPDRVIPHWFCEWRRP